MLSSKIAVRYENEFYVFLKAFPRYGASYDIGVEFFCCKSHDKDPSTLIKSATQGKWNENGEEEMAKWLRREHSDAEKRNGFKFFLTENSYYSQIWSHLGTNVPALQVWKIV